MKSISFRTPGHCIPGLALLALAPGALAQTADEATEAAYRPVFAEVPWSATVVDADHATLGRLHDLVLDPKSGKLAQTVVDLTGPGEGAPELRAIAYREVSWSAELEAFVSTKTKAMLLEMPAFDPHTLRLAPDGPLADAAGEMAEKAGKVKEAAARSFPSKVLASDLSDRAIHAAGEPVASIAGLVLEPNHGAVAYALLTTQTQSDAPYVAPWRALVLSARGEVTFAGEAPDLTEAPVLPPEGVQALSEKTFREEVHGFYGVKPERYADGRNVPG